jgi:hypothetical protein
VYITGYDPARTPTPEWSLPVNPPLVSVLMAVYNGEELLPGTLRSLQAQELKDFELVVVDDGSGDHSARVVEQAGDTRFRLVRQENTGLTRALNRGLEHCRAPLVARIDCGDRCHPLRLRRQVQYLDQHPEVLALGCRVRRLDREGEVLGISEVVCDPRRIHGGLLNINLFQHSSLVMRRRALEEVGGYRPFFRYAQDLDLLMRLSERGPLANLPDVLSDWVLDPASISFRCRRNQGEYAAIARACARQRRAGLPDPVDAGRVQAPRETRSSESEQERDYRLELARSCLMGGSRPRARRELGAACSAGAPVATVAGLWTLSWLPRPVFEALRALRVRRLARPS